MKRNIAQTWVIILAVICVTLTLAMFLTTKYKNKTAIDKTIEQEFTTAQSTLSVSTATEPKLYLALSNKPMPLPVPPLDNQYAIQILSVTKKENAETLLKKLLEGNVKAYIAEANMEGKGTLYRVYIGPLGNYTQATIALPDIKTTYKDAFIIKIN